MNKFKQKQLKYVYSCLQINPWVLTTFFLRLLKPHRTFGKVDRKVY